MREELHFAERAAAAGVGPALPPRAFFTGTALLGLAVEYPFWPEVRAPGNLRFWSGAELEQHGKRVRRKLRATANLRLLST